MFSTMEFSMKWSFSYNSFVKLSPNTRSIPMDPKQSIIKGLHCTGINTGELSNILSMQNTCCISQTAFSFIVAELV